MASDDIIQRLEELWKDDCTATQWAGNICVDAIAEIKGLRWERDEAREAARWLLPLAGSMNTRRAVDMYPWLAAPPTGTPEQGGG